MAKKYYFTDTRYVWPLGATYIKWQGCLHYLFIIRKTHNRWREMSTFVNMANYDIYMSFSLMSWLWHTGRYAIYGQSCLQKRCVAGYFWCLFRGMSISSLNKEVEIPTAQCRPLCVNDFINLVMGFTFAHFLYNVNYIQYLKSEMKNETSFYNIADIYIHNWCGWLKLFLYIMCAADSHCKHRKMTDKSGGYPHFKIHKISQERWLSPIQGQDIVVTRCGRPTYIKMHVSPFCLQYYIYDLCS